jgi:NADH-quinone oxidoreductase subunit L
LEGWGNTLGVQLVRWIAILPLAAAMTHGLLIGLVRARISARSVHAISFSALATAFALSLLSLFDLVGRSSSEPILDTVGPWLGVGVGDRSFSAELTFQFDPLSAVFCLAITSIGLAVYAYAIGLERSGSIPEGDSSHRTFAMLDLLIGSTLVLVLADNFLLLFLGWAGVGIASQLFAAYRFDEQEAARAGATTFVIGRVGDLGLLGASLLLFDGLARAGAPALTFRGIEAAFRLLEGQGIEWLARAGAVGPSLLEIVGLGLVLAALTKCAQLPLHVWLPASTGAPVSAAALMQSATTVVAGVYVLLRFSFLLESAPIAMSVLVWLGASTMILASLAAAAQLDLMRLVAYTTSGQLGLVLLGIGLGANSTAVFHLLTHAFVKAHLILAFGLVVVSMRGETDLRRFGGLGYRMRWTQGMAALACLALIGTPPLSGFVSIEELLAFVYVSDRPERLFLLAGLFFGLGTLAFAMGRAFFLVFWGNVRPGGRVETQLQDPEGWSQHSLTALAVMVFAAGMLTPSQFWGDLWNVEEMDSIGHFLSATLAGRSDPGLAGSERVWLIATLCGVVAAGVGLSQWRYARRGYRGEPKQPASRIAMTTLREMFYVERLYAFVLVRPLREISRWALVGGIEQRLIDRVVVTGGTGLVRRVVWSGLRRLQNGRLQSYALLGLLAAVVVVTWVVV